MTIAELLAHGEVEVLGRMPWSSNATLLVNLTIGSDELLAIYKPQRGERPLWDFPTGTLCRREAAAGVVSRALGWDLVPDTVLRDGPFGLGMVQRYVEHDPDRHYFALLEERGEDLRRMAAFDIVVNNADRKGGHCLEAATDGRIFGIDHGLCFHAQWKLRTVIWDFGGEPVPSAVTDDLARLAEELATGGLDADLGGLLDRFEHDALGARVRALLASGIFPEPDPGHHCYPWPMI
ncbi:MAG: SCO1664 family protein [Actinomycetota bacterium]